VEFRDVLRRRRMVRDYDPDRGVEPAALERVLAAAIRAPSAGFSQGWDFLVLTDPDDRAHYWDVAADPDDPDESADAWLRGMRAAPVLVVCLGNKDAYLDRYAEPDKGAVDRDDARWPVDYWDVDTGMAALLMLLAAVDEGLGACFFGVPVPRHPAVREAFGIPEGRSFVGVVSLGHAAPDESRMGSAGRRPRRGLDEVVHGGRFGSGRDPRGRDGGGGR
jgi:nitroreductase